MNTFDPRNVQCPHCKNTKLRAIEDNERIIAYDCSVCGSGFDREHCVDFNRGIICYLAKRRNPDYPAQLNSEDFYENLKKTEKLNQVEIPFYTNTYVIGSKKFDESCACAG